MVSFAKSDVIAACESFGPQLQVPVDLSGPAVMQAIASNESSIGANCGPRQEPAYSTGGVLVGPEQSYLLRQYGDAVAGSSHGPWQMMFINFSPEAQTAIAAGTADVTTFAQEFVRFFNAYVIRARHAQDLAQIGEVWNLGHVGSDPLYVEKLTASYQSFGS